MCNRVRLREVTDLLKIPFPRTDKFEYNFSEVHPNLEWVLSLNKICRDKHYSYRNRDANPVWAVNENREYWSDHYWYMNNLVEE